MACLRNNQGYNMPISFLPPVQIMCFLRHKTDVQSDDDGNRYVDQVHIFSYIHSHKQQSITTISAFQANNMGTNLV